MAITRKTADEFANDIEQNILARNSSYDVKVGPIADLVVRPMANVLEIQNERIRVVQQLLSLINDGTFTEEDLDEVVFNESLVRLSGSRATVTLIFSRVSAPTTNITVKANFPVGTVADEASGTSFTFLTLVDTTMIAANAATYFNSETQRYELQVAAESVLSSVDVNVAANRIIVPLQPLVDFDSVFNRDVATGARDPEPNNALIDRYFLSLLGTSPGVVNGISKIVRDKFLSVEDANVVFGNNPLNVRSATDGGAVDVFIIGESPITFTENIVFPGTAQTIPLSKQPVINLVSAGSFVQGVDFVLVKDTSGNRLSVRGTDGISWLATGSSPSIGDVVTVTYVYNGLVQILQNGFTQNDRNVPGRDILFKVADQVDITLSANIKIRPGFNVTTVVDAVSVVVLNFINNGRLGSDVEASDIQAVVRNFSSVDNFIITNLAKVGNTGTSDILIGDNEYARMADADLIISVI